VTFFHRSEHSLRSLPCDIGIADVEIVLTPDAGLMDRSAAPPR
jgi:hypothetical protein